MKDRISTKPGRVLLTPEDGSSPFYATITRADEPTQNGDPLNKNTLLKNETAALYGLDASALPDEVFALLKTLVDNAQSSADSKVKIQTGSYVGTGTHGEDSPCSLTFNFVPKVVYIIQYERTSISSGSKIYIIEPHFIQMVSGAKTGSGDYAYKQSGESDYTGGMSVVLCSFKDKTVSWYNCIIGFYEYSAKAINQMNDSGTKYYYIAMG